MQRLDAISTTNWQPALGRYGEIVEDLADIGQCIRVILATPKGSVPQRPLFGSDVRLYLDYPINEAMPHLVRESVEAIQLWEPRAKVMRVTVSPGEAGVTLTVFWQPVGTDADEQVMEVSL